MSHSDTQRCPYCGGLTYLGYDELVLPSGGSADEWAEAETYLLGQGVDLTRCSCVLLGPEEPLLFDLAG